MTNINTDFVCTPEGQVHVQVHFTMHGRPEGLVVVRLNGGDEQTVAGNAAGTLHAWLPLGTDVYLNIDREGDETDGDRSLFAGNTGEVGACLAPPPTAPPPAPSTPQPVAPPPVAITGQAVPHTPAEQPTLPATGAGLLLIPAAIGIAAVGRGLQRIARRK